MASYSKMTLLGNVVAEPEYKENSTVRFRIATDQYDGKDGNGNARYKGVYWYCVAFQKTEYFTKHITKGTQVFIEGEPTQKEYTGNDGVKKQYVEVVVRNIIALQRAKTSADVQTTTSNNRAQENVNTQQLRPEPNIPPIVEANKDLFGEVVTGTSDDLPF